MAYVELDEGPETKKRRLSLSKDSSHEELPVATTSRSSRRRAISKAPAAPPLRTRASKRNVTSSPRCAMKEETDEEMEVEAQVAAESEGEDKPSAPTPDENDACEDILKAQEKKHRDNYKTLKRKFRELEASTAKTLLELDKREIELTKMEKDATRQQKQADKKAHSLSKREHTVKKLEQQSNELLLTVTASKAETVMEQFDAHFSCALCFEVMACPYSLSPANCGHTFCSLCILKWFFSHCKADCGHWHHNIECPLCRTPLPHIDQEPPRSLNTFPFTPNRLADEVINDLVNSIAGPQQTNSASRNKDKKRGVDEPGWLGWLHGGTSRRDWQQRDRKGRAEMTALASTWGRMRGDDFLAFRRRLT